MWMCRKACVLLLCGPSGCGKSTWLALVAALMPPPAGRSDGGRASPECS
ncbi:MAG: hypothetical protein IPI20_12920 [Rhodoferax sp.]|nr:hypothetical protein [Rhodoferax sp.]